MSRGEIRGFRAGALIPGSASLDPGSGSTHSASARPRKSPTSVMKHALLEMRHVRALLKQRALGTGNAAVKRLGHLRRHLVVAAAEDEGGKADLWKPRGDVPVLQPAGGVKFRRPVEGDIDLRRLNQLVEGAQKLRRPCWICFAVVHAGRRAVDGRMPIELRVPGARQFMRLPGIPDTTLTAASGIAGLPNGHAGRFEGERRDAPLAW